MTLNTPILPLEFWRQIIGYNPWHFWGLADDTVYPVTSKCNDVVREYGWQATDEAGRSDIREAIMTAESILFEKLRFWPAPIYSTDTLPWPRYVDQRLYRTTRSDVRGGWIPVHLRESFVEALGVETLTAIDLDAALVYSDSDGDGLDETFTVTVATTVTDPNEIAIYFTLADRLVEDNALSARWRIEPVQVTISAGNAIIKGKRWLVVKPVLYEVKTSYPIDSTVDTNFITECSVYRRYTFMDGLDSNVDSQAALIWESRPCWWGCNSATSSSDPASEGWVTARGGIRSGPDGIVTPAQAVYNASTGTWAALCECTSQCSEPDRVLVRYLAGMPLDSNGWMQNSMRTLVSRLAAAEMTRRICACDQANREWSNWQFDVSRVNAPETYQAGLNVLDNPLGTRRGHIYAWQQILQLARVSGVLP